jgi:hypothetical protein
MGSHRLSTAELASVILEALWEKDRLSPQCTSLLSGHQEFGEVKTNCPPSHSSMPSCPNLMAGDQGTEWSAELRGGPWIVQFILVGGLRLLKQTQSGQQQMELPSHFLRGL